MPHFPHSFPKNTKYSLIKFYIAMMIPKSWMTFELNVVISPTTRSHSDFGTVFHWAQIWYVDNYLIKYWLIWISQNVLNQIANHQSQTVFTTWILIMRWYFNESSILSVVYFFFKLCYIYIAFFYYNTFQPNFWCKKLKSSVHVDKSLNHPTFVLKACRQMTLLFKILYSSNYLN